MDDKFAQAQMERVLNTPGFVVISDESVVNVRKVTRIDPLNRVVFFPDQEKGEVGKKVDNDRWDHFISEYKKFQ
ncbi:MULTISPECIES: hypothetical protein [unclassified Paenibacillus]|uniref:hypothetical protein n=1 Tax=unclassified Paenibacillus TaxID=185978 RepID=UPI0009A72593|nr:MULTISPECIES: hypothetical protein [unclassified Paenibacillus]SLJ92738.1 hypothetical protein SAMN06272722_1011130 [Paenibacillus sp. RU5A]SOC58518.1 hypothetical protein SAMN05880581_10160 [Paenibacillus sp. RU26A]SOC67570.1 hypothetical protein SAMN05880586_10160 [Paenibacillus sp. RU5M]